MYEFWCGVTLRDVRSAILTAHQNEYIYFHIQPITFLLHTHHYINRFCKNNIELEAKLKLKFMKTLWRHDNAGINRFYMRYVIDCKQ